MSPSRPKETNALQRVALTCVVAEEMGKRVPEGRV